MSPFYKRKICFITMEISSLKLPKCKMQLAEEHVCRIFITVLRFEVRKHTIIKVISNMISIIPLLTICRISEGYIYIYRLHGGILKLLSDNFNGSDRRISRQLLTE